MGIRENFTEGVESKILFLGDIFGRAGRRAAVEFVRDFRAKNADAIIVANAENAAGGFGINKKIANELTDAGIDAITLGNHIWDQKEFAEQIDDVENLCRPANLPSCCPGKRYLVLEKNGIKFCVLSIIGRSFMKTIADCPFITADSVLKEIEELGIKNTIVDIHAETTSEKYALGWHLSKRVTCVIGTHTHVQTADERILEASTAYMTDAGMCGPQNGIIGVKKETVVQNFIDGMPRRLETIRSGPTSINGALITFNHNNGRAKTIDRINKEILVM